MRAEFMDFFLDRWRGVPFGLPCLVALTGFISATTGQGAESTRPNIVVIVADDLGYGELGCQGGRDVQTPNIDSIARAGIRCTDGYVSCPVCSPTRAGLLTGRYQQRFGHEFNPGPEQEASDQFGLPLSEKTLADRLRQAGYRTALVGKWHEGYRLGYRPLDRGFEHFFGFLGGSHAYLPGRRERGDFFRQSEPIQEPEYLTEAFGREASAYIARQRGEPFFLLLTFNAVHAPLQSTARYLARFPASMPEKRRTFCAMLSALDDAVGQVLASLKKQGIDQNTLLFFLSDNGGPTLQTTSSNGPLRGYKGEVWEGGIRVPFLVQWPDRLPAGKVYREPVIALDIAPTALAAARVAAADARFDGVDLLPFLQKESPMPPHAELYWRFGDQHAIRQGKWKLVVPRDGMTRLVDLSADIGESQDLSTQQPDIRKALETAYAAWNSQLAAPRWERGRPRRERNAAP